MTARIVQGEHLHIPSGTVVRFVGRYELKAIGVVYEADAFLNRRSTSIVRGVIAWGFRAIPPKRRVEATIRETIDLIDMDKLVAALNESHV